MGAIKGHAGRSKALLRSAVEFDSPLLLSWGFGMGEGGEVVRSKHSEFGFKAARPHAQKNKLCALLH